MKTRMTAAVGAALTLASGVGLVFGSSALGAGVLPPNNPPNIPKAVYESSCYTNTTNVNVRGECIAKDLYAIDLGRAEEKLPPMILPVGYNNMSLREQEWVVTNLERGDRGEPQFIGLYSKADTDADQGARDDTDPTSTTGANIYGVIWAGSANVLGSDVLWMYYDGPGGSNGDCKVATDPGCWGHRDNILGDYQTANSYIQYMGASSLAGPSEAEEFGGLNVTSPDVNPTDVRFKPLTFPANNRPGIVNLSGHHQDPGDRLIITGVGFTGATTVKIGGFKASDVSVQSDSEIDCTIPKGPSGTVNVRVFSPDGESVTAAGITTITYN